MRTRGYIRLRSQLYKWDRVGVVKERGVKRRDVVCEVGAPTKEWHRLARGNNEGE